MTKTAETEVKDHIDAEPFGVEILHGATFKVDWATVQKVAKQGREGGQYSAPCILTEIKGYVVPVWVELTRRDFDAIRLLKIQGIKVFSCILGVKGDKERYAPRIWSAGKDW